MPIGADLIEAMRSFAALEREIAAMSDRDATADTVRLVKLRRELVLEFARLGTALESDPYLVAHPEKMTQATRLFAAFRTQNSANQADWPVIRVRDNLQAYKLSTRSVEDCSTAFWGWAERELGFRRQMA